MPSQPSPVVPPAAPQALSGARVLVTGASRGIGRALAVGMARAGAAVAVTARDASGLAGAAAEIQQAGGTVTCHAADLAQTAALPDLVGEATRSLGGTVDVVVHAAGVQARGPALDLSDDEWERVVALNLTAPWRLSVEVARSQQAAGHPGSHTFIASMLAVTSRPGVSPYVASKTGLLGVIRSLSTEWAPAGIRVNGIAPGYIETALTRPLFEQPDWRRETLARVPLGRFGQVDDMVGPAVFLASSASAYMTGQLMVVDGGWTSS
ncbi:SDR family NAD(P)-dependent oxidoreductase [Ornithinimicrobium cavernae]|uniref:SDR family NAD(P)-dependent oxidoreductase n=1 Tax=Ornithinimicrobium cavernae TaxID=2666047 RepID=UPI000D688EAD|nr:SDR family oxidoreductase [Ornithinimicrobium cavernae]